MNKQEKWSMAEHAMSCANIAYDIQKSSMIGIKLSKLSHKWGDEIFDDANYSIGVEDLSTYYAALAELEKHCTLPERKTLTKQQTNALPEEPKEKRRPGRPRQKHVREVVSARLDHETLKALDYERGDGPVRESRAKCIERLVIEALKAKGRL